MLFLVETLTKAGKKTKNTNVHSLINKSVTHFFTAMGHASSFENDNTVEFKYSIVWLG